MTRLPVLSEELGVSGALRSVNESTCCLRALPEPRCLPAQAVYVLLRNAINPLCLHAVPRLVYRRARGGGEGAAAAPAPRGSRTRGPSGAAPRLAHVVRGP